MLVQKITIRAGWVGRDTANRTIKRKSEHEMAQVLNGVVLGGFKPEPFYVEYVEDPLIKIGESSSIVFACYSCQKAWEDRRTAIPVMEISEDMRKMGHSHLTECLAASKATDL